MSGLFPISLDDMIACVARELEMRKRVYPRWVSQHKMSQEAADREIDTMRAIHDKLANERKNQ